jgi:serine/threonine protein kinase
VIIKVPLVSPESSAPSNSDFAFLNELETIKKFQGVSNLVQCYGYVRLTDPPRHGMVLEKAQFGSLADLLNRPVIYQQLPSSILYEWLSCIAQGLLQLHDYGVLHQDLKPSNVLLFDDDKLTVKITDFGLSRQLCQLNVMENGSGTLPYCAPEIRNKGQASLPSDIFSWAMTAVALLSGSDPRLEYADCLNSVCTEKSVPASFRQLLVTCIRNEEKPYRGRPTAIDLCVKLNSIIDEENLFVDDSSWTFCKTLIGTSFL